MERRRAALVATVVLTAGTGELTRAQMLGAGVVLDALMVVVGTGLLSLFVPR